MASIITRVFDYLGSNAWTTEVVEVGGGGSQPAPWTGPFIIYGLKWQTIDMSGDPPATGSFTVSYDGVESDPIASDADDAALLAALESIPALTGKATVTTAAFPTGTAEIMLDDSLAPFALLAVDDNSLGVADPLIYVYGSLVEVPLLTPTEGAVLADFLISITSDPAFGSGSEIFFSPESGDADWPQGMGLLIDSQDNGENWGGASSGDANAYRSVALAAAASGGNSYNTMPAPIHHTSAIKATLSLAGQGTGGVVQVWVKVEGVVAPS